MKNRAAIRESYLLLVISGLGFYLHFHSQLLAHLLLCAFQINRCFTSRLVLHNAPNKLEASPFSHC